MLMEKIIAVHVPGTAPINANVTYLQGSPTILVQIIPQDLSMKVFAPPFLIPGGDVWEVFFTVQTEGVVFSNVTFSGVPPGLLKSDGAPTDPTNLAWKTTFDTRNLTNDVEMLRCGEFFLSGGSGPSRGL